MDKRVEAVVHGAIDFAELERLGIHPENILDFGVNSNPYGPSPLILQALQSVPIERYPDRESIALRRALSEYLGISSEKILVGNGTAELIQLLAFAFLQGGENVLVAEPTFGEYERSVRLMKANVHRWKAKSQDGFIFNIEEIQRKIYDLNPRLVFICNPNNPTGQILSLDILDEWALAFPETLFVIDEAYISFVREIKSSISLRRKNILTLRSMTKEYAIAGLRLGYVVGDEFLIDAMKNFRSAWNVNSFSQAAGIAALQSEVYLKDTLQKLMNEKEKFVFKLNELDYQPVHSFTNYFLIPVGNASNFRANLLQYGILVRDCTSFGLPAYVRIATRTPEENIRLLNILREIEK